MIEIHLHLYSYDDDKHVKDINIKVSVPRAELTHCALKKLSVYRNFFSFI